MQLTDERIAYLTKLIVDYEEFLTRKHKPAFYEVVLSIINKTNEKHCISLINNAKEQLDWYFWPIPN